MSDGSNNVFIISVILCLILIWLNQFFLGLVVIIVGSLWSLYYDFFGGSDKGGELGAEADQSIQC